MKGIARIIFGLGVALFLLGMIAGCGGKTGIGYIQQNPEKYVGKKVTVEGGVMPRNTIQSFLDFSKPCGEIDVKYDGIEAPKFSSGLFAGRNIRASGIVKLQEERSIFGQTGSKNLEPVLVIKSWKYLPEDEELRQEKLREKHKKDIIK